LVIPTATAYNYEFASATNAPRLARDSLAPLAAEIGEELLTSLRLVVSELVTNAVTFGPNEPISLTLEVEEGSLVRGFVDDRGSSGVELVDVDPIAATGLGLQIVDALTTDWGVDAGSTRVWFELERS
jgi:anti-sigma regulatory factor (Ser/Thr protein kinase)